MDDAIILPPAGSDDARADPKSSDAESLCEVARRSVQRDSSLILQLPLQWGALSQGINPRTYLAKVTGISKSRIAKGSLNELRPSTVTRAADHSLRVSRERAVKLGWSESEFGEVLSNAPRLSDGLPSQLGGMFHLGSESDAVDLGETTRLAVAFEELAVQLNKAAKTGTWDDARLAALAFLRTKAWQESHSALQLTGLETASGWHELHVLLDRLLIDGFVGLFVTLDAEWGAQYFRSLQPQPVLLWLSPEVKLDSEGRLVTRNGIRRPIRKLLELTFAIAERIYSGRWPDAPPGRKAVGDILEQSDAHAGNYFDGTKKLSVRAFETWWMKLTTEMQRKYGKAEQFAAPFVLARVALLWQGCWMKPGADKSLVVIVPEPDEYRRRWHAVRRRLSAKYPQGQGDWPDWLTAQPSSSLSTASPSSASSGRSS